MATLQDIPVESITGEPQTLRDYAGKVLLVVNVASKCGLTPQYEGLESLYRTYKDRGLEVLGFPANDFMGQEPGSEPEIEDFCKTTYDVTFPMFSKIKVSGAAKHPLYAELVRERPRADGKADEFRKALVGHGIEANPEPEVLWNFEKFLVGRDGKVVARFAPNTEPRDPALVSAVESALAH